MATCRSGGARLLGAQSRTHLPGEPPLSTPETRLAELPLDDFSKLVLKGALRVAADTENPVRLNLFAAAIRELFGHIPCTGWPDAEVAACAWFTFHAPPAREVRHPGRAGGRFHPPRPASMWSLSTTAPSPP